MIEASMIIAILKSDDDDAMGTRRPGDRSTIAT
jgi:hypothetical protein